MDLGQGIRRALAKITGATLVDESAVRELVKELQRVLITNDVNVRLVFELTKKIEERALKEKPVSGLTTREHVVKVVYEELQKILGGKYEPKLEKKKILLCGLFGSGKCVHPDSLIPLPNGELKTIKEIYDSVEGLEVVVEDGFVKEVKPFEVFSVDLQTLKMVKAKCSTVWKLKKTTPLFKITVDNGSGEKISVTPEHPFFVLDEGRIIQKRAVELKLGDYVALPRRLNFQENDGEIESLNVLRAAPRATRVASKELALAISKFARENFGSLKNSVKKLCIKRPYCCLSAELKKGEVDAGFLAECVKNGFIFRPVKELVFKSGQRTMRFPCKLTVELAEFAGYVYGNGNLEKRAIHFTNANVEIITRFVELSELLFGVKPRILREKTSNARVTRVSINSKVITAVFSKLFGLPQKKKTNVMKIPFFLMTSRKEVKTAFLRAFFDCVGIIASGHRCVEVATASKEFAFQLRAMLLSLGLSSSFSVKRLNNKNYYRVFLSSEDAEKFAVEVGSLLQRKKRLLNAFKEIGVRQTKGKLENLNVGSLLKKVREYYEASNGNVQNYVSSYGIREFEGITSRNALQKFFSRLNNTKNANNAILSHCVEGKRKEELRNVLNANYGWHNGTMFRLKQEGLINETNGIIQTTSIGRALLQKIAGFDLSKITFLKLLAESDLNWAKVKKIELDESTEYVYDLSVDETHNFVANNFIVHNTTTVSKLAKFYQDRGLKTAVIAADVHRPAAFEQLKQLSEQVKCGFYGIKSEKNAVKIIENALKELAKFDVLILDSAGRSAFDAELVEELKSVTRAFQPDEKLLVVSADVGQVAGKQAQEFDKAIGLTGVIITKMDGSGKGGGALSSVAVSGGKIAFIGTGEKPSDFQPFDSTKFVAQLVGFPDLQTLLEKLKEASDVEIAERALEEGKLDYESFLAQMRAMRKMGPLKQVMQMLGLYDLPEELVGKSEEKMKKFEAAVLSMTPRERANPELMKHRDRQERVARGAGLKVEEVRDLVNNFEKVSKLVKGLRKNRGMLKQLGKFMPGVGKLSK